MSKLAFLADEHVNRAYVSALRSTGYRVLSVDDDYEPGKADSELLATGRSEGLVIITSDDDFVERAEDVEVLTEHHPELLEELREAVCDEE